MAAAAAQRGAQSRKPQPSPAASDNYYDIKSTIFNALIDAIDLTQLGQLDRDGARDEIRDIVNEIITLKDVAMSIAEQEELLEDICNDVLGYGPLEPLLARDDIADIMVNGANTCFIEVAGKMQKTGVRFRDNSQLLNICQRIVSQIGRRVDEASPDLRRPPARRFARQRHRAAAGDRRADAHHPQVQEGPPEAARSGEVRLDHAGRRDDPRDHRPGALQRPDLRRHRLRQDHVAQLPDRLSSTHDERVITCEDAAELQLQQPHVVRLETRPPNLEGEGEITMRDLVKNCLRMRPERIIVGEVRGPEAFDLLQAMNTGHDGSMGTLHANSPREALSRLESMITMGGFALPSKTIKEMIVGSIDVIVQAARLRDGSRRITHITEVVGMEGDVIITQDLFVYEIMGEDANGRIIGRHRSTGIARPHFWDRARYYGEERRLAEALERAEMRNEGEDAEDEGEDQ